MANILFIIAIIGLSVAQASFFGPVKIAGIIPNVLLIAIIMGAPRVQATSLLAAALTGGLLLDIISGTDFGLKTAFYLICGLGLVSLKQQGLHLDSIWLSTVFAGAASVVFSLVTAAGIWGSVMESPGRFTSIMLGEATLNMGITALLQIMTLIFTRSRQQELRRQTWH